MINYNPKKPLPAPTVPRSGVGLPSEPYQQHSPMGTPSSPPPGMPPVNYKPSAPTMPPPGMPPPQSPQMGMPTGGFVPPALPPPPAPVVPPPLPMSNPLPVNNTGIMKPQMPAPMPAPMPRAPQPVNYMPQVQLDDMPSTWNPMPIKGAPGTPQTPDGGRGFVPPPTGNQPTPPKGRPGDPDPSGGRGTIPPPTKEPNLGAKQRTKETLAERADRLQGRIDEGKGNKERLHHRIGKLNRRVEAGKKTPKNYKQPDMKGTPKKDSPKDKPNKPGFEDNPEKWTPARLAELAPPKGMATFFRDVGNYEGTDEARKKLKTKKLAVKAKLKDQRKTNNKRTIRKIKKAKDKKKDATPKDEGQAEATSFQANEPNGTNKGSDIGDVLTKKQKGQRTKARLKKQLSRLRRKTHKLNKPGKRPQPGTPKRPYRSHGVSYSPLSSGGKLRV